VRREPVGQQLQFLLGVIGFQSAMAHHDCGCVTNATNPRVRIASGCANSTCKTQACVVRGSAGSCRADGDWNPMTPKQELKLLTDRPQVARKGIILLQIRRPYRRDAAAFLRYLRDNGYHVVHWCRPDRRLTLTGSRIIRTWPSPDD